MANKKAGRSRTRKKTRPSGVTASLRRHARLITVGGAIAAALLAILLFTDPFASPTAIDADGTRVKTGPLNERASAAPREGRIAPNFLLADYDGNAVRLSDFAGKVVFLNFWATWCTACEAEMPDMNRLAEKYSDDLVVLAVNRGESSGRAERWSSSRQLENIVFVVDPNESISGAYQLPSGMPYSLFIDDEGFVTAVIPGAQTFFTMEQNLLAALGNRQ